MLIKVHNICSRSPRLTHNCQSYRLMHGLVCRPGNYFFLTSSIPHTVNTHMLIFKGSRIPSPIHIITVSETAQVLWAISATASVLMCQESKSLYRHPNGSAHASTPSAPILSPFFIYLFFFIRRWKLQLKAGTELNLFSDLARLGL